MQTITKEKIAKELHDRLGLSMVICEELVTQTFQSAIELIMQEKVLKIKNLGSFTLHQKNARPGMDWKTGKQTTISPRKVVRFTPSRNLKARLQHDA